MRKSTEILWYEAIRESNWLPGQTLLPVAKKFRRLVIQNERECAEPFGTVWDVLDDFIIAKAGLSPDLPVYIGFPPAAQVPSWQPIATAPKDGKAVFALMKNGAMTGTVWLDGDYPDIEDAGWYEHWHFDPVDPIYWMPMPNMPTKG